MKIKVKSIVNNLDSWCLWEDLPCNLRSWVFYRFQTMGVPGLRWCQNGLRFWGEYWLRESSCKCFAKRSWYFPQSLVSSAIPFRMNQFRSVFMDLSIFSQVLFPIEPMMPKQTLIRVSKMVSATVGALEWVGTWFTFFHFQSWQIDFGISLTAPTKFSMMFRFVRSIVFDALGSLNPARKCSMASLPAVFALQYTRIHVGFLNGHNIIAYIETPVD